MRCAAHAFSLEGTRLCSTGRQTQKSRTTLWASARLDVKESGLLRCVALSVAGVDGGGVDRGFDLSAVQPLHKRSGPLESGL